MAAEKVAIWLTEDGTYTDQFGEEHGATFVLEQTIAEQVDKTFVDDGYGGKIPKWTYKDSLGRYFTHTASIGYGPSIQYYIQVDEDGNRITTGPTSEKGVFWQKARVWKSKGPYITPDGKNKVDPLDPEGNRVHISYRDAQIRMTKLD